MLDAFQSAAQTVALQEVGVLIPLYDFYPSIESFLDTTVKRTIEQATANPSLEPFDIKLLQVLFLIRYVEEIKGNVDNLVTLCLGEVDADRLALRHRIENHTGPGGCITAWKLRSHRKSKPSPDNFRLRDQHRINGKLHFRNLPLTPSQNKYQRNKELYLK